MRGPRWGLGAGGWAVLAPAGRRLGGTVGLLLVWLLQAATPVSARSWTRTGRTWTESALGRWGMDLTLADHHPSTHTNHHHHHPRTGTRRSGMYPTLKAAWGRLARGLAGLVTAVTLLGALGPAAQAASLPAPGPSASYVLRATPGALPAVEHKLARLGGHVTRELRLLNGAAVTLPPAALPALQADQRVAELTPNARVHLLGSTTTTTSTSYDPFTDVNSMYNIEQVIGARQMWTQATGTGVDVALIDSGVAPVTGLSGTNKVINGPDLSFESQNTATRYLDSFGHGTHMAGIIAGHDPGINAPTAAGNATAFLGVAPDARIISLKVADAQGETDVSQVIAAIDWVVQHAHDPGFNIRVLNLSFGTDAAQAYTLDPLAYAAEVAWRSGIVVVTSAGNSGAASGRLTNPAIDPFVLAVGADDSLGTLSTRDDTIPSFSSYGDGTRNPDLVAPGAHVQSLRVPGSYIDSQYASTGAINDRYFRGSGTSQAAAVTSGAAALLLQQRPELTPDQVKAILNTTATLLPAASTQGQGHGMVNLRAAFAAATPTVASQPFAPSTGTGTLEGARGSGHLVLNNVTLQGERDIFTQAFDATAMASAEAAQASWSGGVWNGNPWTGSGLTGSSWDSVAWSGEVAWDGRTWAGRTWATGTWTGSAWTSGSWTGRTWAGAKWSISGFSSRLWACGGWK
jgi:serine protease AprX